MQREEWGEMKGSVRLGETSERREERKAHREDGKRFYIQKEKRTYRKRKTKTKQA